MRTPRLSIAGAVLVLLSTVVAAFAAAQPASAQAVSQPPGTSDVVEVAEVSGLLDPILVSFVEDRIDAANAEGLVALVLQLNSSGSVVDDERIVDLARKIARSPVPVAVWVGASKAQATGPAAQLVAMARPGGLAPGARVGRTGDQLLPREEFGVLYGESANRLRDGFVRYDDARSVGLVDAATLGDFVIDLEGVATREAAVAGETRRELVTTGRSVQLPLGKQLMHTVASPSVAYLLFVIGVGLIVFEFFTAGIGLAGLCGAAFLVLGCFGLAVLPARWWGIGLLLASFVAFAADVQLGVPRLPTAIGGVLFAAGTLTLYDGVSLSWITMLAAFVLVGVVFLRGMPAMVRSRFSTPDIGRDWLAGEPGVVTSASGDEGVVAVRAARWPARATTPSVMVVGERVTVVGSEGIVLEVAPSEAAASPPENASVVR